MSPAIETQVKIGCGLLQGKTVKSDGGKDFLSFTGIPYAEPPVGELRFKTPVPKKPWTGILDATKSGNNACQFDIQNQKLSGSEDCLNLNVYTPRLPDENDEELLPVMFYIHGGGFVFGSGSSEEFGADYLVEHDVVVVVINYRLGAFGFMCLDIPEVPGNAGLRDQNLAMKWVQENIRAFNGNPDNVTIFGISAGSASVEYHLLSPMSKGLFHKAILQSGSSLNPWAKTHNPKRTVSKFKKLLLIEEEDPQKVLNILQGLDPSIIIAKSMLVAGDEERKNGELFTFTPVVEKSFKGVDTFLNKEPIELLEDGLINKVPTISGFCAQEGPLFKAFYGEEATKQIQNRNFIDYLPECFNVDRIFFNQNFEEIYHDADEVENANDFLSDLLFLSGIYESFKHRSRFTNTDYFYMFSFEGNISFIKSWLNITDKRTYHGDDTAYVGFVNRADYSNASNQDRLMRSRMTKMWSNFAKTGNPTPEKSDLIPTEWLPATCHHMHLLEMSNDLKMKKFPFAERMNVWENIYESSINLPRK